MKKNRSIHLMTIFLIFIFLISFIQEDINQISYKNDDNSIRSPLRTPKFDVATEDANITHNFVEKFSFTFGTNSNDSVRHISLGYPHPDGILRLLIGSSQKTNGSLHVLKQSGGPFNYVKEGEYIYSYQEWSYLEPILCHDFDSDGVEEILIVLYDPSSLLFIGWNGTGYSPKWQTISSQMSVHSGAQIYDIDRDSKPELITYSSSETKIYSWDYGFVNFTHDATLTGGGWDVGIGDIDRDGQAEIITSMMGSDSSVRVWGFNGTNYVQEYINYYTGHDKGFVSFCTVDIDNDDDLEIIGGTPNWGGIPYLITMFEWDGSNLIPYNLTQDTAAHFEIKAGDIDGDGLDEVVIDRNGGDSTIVELAPNGSIVLQDYSILSIYHCIELYDLDGDYIPEIIRGPTGYSLQPLIYQDDVHLPPALVDTSPSAITVELNSVGHNLTWTPIDRQSLSYYLYWEGVEFMGPTTCASGVPIEYNLDSRTGTTGTFNLTIVVNDTDSNKANHSVLITVVPSTLPMIFNERSSPVNPIPGENVTISADVTDMSGISYCIAYYQISGSATWTSITANWAFNDTYQAEIGPFLVNQQVHYYFVAADGTTDQNSFTALPFTFTIADIFGPTIANVSHSPSEPSTHLIITVSAEIDDDSGVSFADLYYRINGGIWLYNPMTLQTGITYEADMGAFNENDYVEYFINATDTATPYNVATADNATNYYSFIVSKHCTIDQVTSVSIELGKPLVLNWTATLAAGHTPLYWHLIVDNTEMDNGGYTSGVPVYYNVTDYLIEPGTYNFTMEFTSSANASCTILVNVLKIDTTTTTTTTAPTTTTTIPTTTTIDVTRTIPESSTTSAEESSEPATLTLSTPGFKVIIVLFPICLLIPIIRRKRK